LPGHFEALVTAWRLGLGLGLGLEGPGLGLNVLGPSMLIMITSLKKTNDIVSDDIISSSNNFSTLLLLQQFQIVSAEDKPCELVVSKIDF